MGRILLDFRGPVNPRLEFANTIAVAAMPLFQMSTQHAIRRLALCGLGLAFVSSCTLLFDPSDSDQTGPRCAGLPSTCGIEGSLDCCQAFISTGFTYQMGRSLAGPDQFATGDADELPEHDANPSDFFLDRFEVTVGRFRAFLADYRRPMAGDGAHPAVSGSGWQAADSAALADDPSAITAQLDCGLGSTWTDDPGANESKPITCVTWYELYAFCIWDGGRLPTEAEWEFVAAAGLNNSLFPWGPDPADGRASFGDDAPPVDVGSFPGGQTSQGHRDLAGNVWEWTRDRYSDVWYEDTGNSCIDCINLDMPSSLGFAIRGGGFNDVEGELRAASRGTVMPDLRVRNVGGRCARDLQ